MNEETTKRQKQEKCPNCGSKHIVETNDRNKNYYWGCDSCGHTWVGQQFSLGGNKHV